MTTESRKLVTYFRTPALSTYPSEKLFSALQNDENLIKNAIQVVGLETEFCFYIELAPSIESLTPSQSQVVHWLLSETYERSQTRESASFIVSELNTNAHLLEIGPRLSFTTAWSSNAVSICQACGLDMITRLESSIRYLIHCKTPLSSTSKSHLTSALLSRECDRMTQQLFSTQLDRLTPPQTHISPVIEVPIMEQGPSALAKVNESLHLGFDTWDLDFYYTLFKDKMKRNPTTVECFDMAQSNSEHSRHWFFSGNLIIDDQKLPQTLFQMVKSTLTPEAQQNSIIAFHDNSSVIRGASYPLTRLTISDPCTSSVLVPNSSEMHLLLTAETHNFPCAVAPFPGAETGTGGRIRDVQATGRGAHVIAGVAGYAVGNLLMEEYALPWENTQSKYPSNLATPLEILLQASDGASDYGNKFGEPVVTGFARAFGMQLGQQRREYIKPIMFSAGVGSIDAQHCEKHAPEVDMWVVKLGGPAYRIGMGGGAASSRVSDPSTAQVDFNAVQRGDAEMESRMNKVIRACIDLGARNPIVSIHDQGAGGNGNVLKEIVYDPNGGGARYDVRKILVGDLTLSVLEIWGAEYQENNAILVRDSDKSLLERICRRERCPFAFLGTVTGDGRVVLFDSNNDQVAVDLDLTLVLGEMPRKTFTDSHFPRVTDEFPLHFPVAEALDRVLRLVSVGSKRFLTTKVDRSVSGLVAQQQTIGPMQIPLANCAILATNYHAEPKRTLTGVATAIGEQPIKGLLDPASMARQTVGEALTNLVWASLAGTLHDIKCSANWMWAAKLPGQAAEMVDCCASMTSFMREIGVAIDGGKDSLSMAVQVDEEHVHAPGTLVITMYAACDNVQDAVTPDFKEEAASSIFYVDLGQGAYRLGGSALTTVYDRIGAKCPNVDDSELFVRALRATQLAVHERLILAGHDRSDGGLLVTLLEMAFGGHCGFQVDIPAGNTAILEALFAEELGLVYQVAEKDVAAFKAIFSAQEVPVLDIGRVTTVKRVEVAVNGVRVLEEEMLKLWKVWEATSFALERRQCRKDCVDAEELSLSSREIPQWNLSFTPINTPQRQLETRHLHHIAIVREEGSNGEREMSAAFYAAGFQVWDVTVSDLLAGRISLDQRFSGVAFVGGFAFADVLGSGKGWAAAIRFHPSLLQQFDAFRAREDTFSLGVCNGCQLMALLGWVDVPSSEISPRFIENASGRHESRFVSIRILQSPAIMLQGMENSSFGVWVSHGQGRVRLEPEVSKAILEKELAPVRYVDDANCITEAYPFNPNGSESGIASLVSPDGRHLCMMPHPERCFAKFQWPWMPTSFKEYETSPWMRMFQNAKAFCERNRAGK
uniref:phosphoribosylformylglycinamidine synthase n=1 Tax=Albugo laibachii Nc14 TaxID=890382 RepID=F0WI18_9STRA|nr:predicted protein putative [Albugo laibachii Nc14]|eukprot:CCA20895.1 predicted protein putative [Albugo laibachii Nc14]